MCSAYSPTARSAQNTPDAAMLIRLILLKRAGSHKAVPIPPAAR